jgi:hypothetical protein
MTLKVICLFLATKYCEASGKECAGINVEDAQFAPTVDQCHARYVLYLFLENTASGTALPNESPYT